MAQDLNEEEMVIAEDALLTGVQFVLHNLLEKKGILRAELARKVGVSDARISQIFGDEPENLTLKTVARLFWAVGEEARITSPAWDEIVPADVCAKPEMTKQVKSQRTHQFDVIEALVRDLDLAGNRFQLECNSNDNELQLVA